MVTKLDRERKAAKQRAVIDRLSEIHVNRETLIGMLDEGKLDMLILALGVGTVTLDPDFEVK